MIDFLSLLGIAVSAFIATNIDDIFVLMLFFSSPKFHKVQVVIGQYLGIGLLVVIGGLGGHTTLEYLPTVAGSVMI